MNLIRIYWRDMTGNAHAKCDEKGNCLTKDLKCVIYFVCVVKGGDNKADNASKYTKTNNLMSS